MNVNLKPLPEQPLGVKGYTPTGDEYKVFEQWKRRKNELLNSRTNVQGINIDTEMRKWDTNYFNRVADIPASELDPDQKPVAICNAYGKVQSALGILIDRNPEITLEETNPRYSANRELMKNLAKQSWRNTNSLGQFKLSIFNAAKRGWFAGRTYNRVLKGNAKYLTEVDEKGKKTYREDECVKMDDVAYQNLNNYNVWIDEEALPEDFYSIRDWQWREVWHIEKIRKLFPEDEFPNMKFVQEGGDTRETIYNSSQNTSANNSGNESKVMKKGMTEVFFYENQYDDWFIVEINGVMVVWEPLPQNSKRLSLVTGYWNLRSAETIYGIGVVEAMERNEQLIDRIMNMDMRQLLLTIAPGGFYSGTEDPEDENLKVKVGTLRRTMNPKDIIWQEIPPGNENGPNAINWLESKEDQMTGISKTIEGETTAANDNPTAFELGVNRESALKRLRLPLKSFQYALEWEFNNRIALIQQVYSDFQVEHYSDQDQINAYLDEVNADPDLFFIENQGEAGKEKFYAKKYRQFQLNLDEDEKGNFVESENKKFFHIKPKYLEFSGIVQVDIGSILVQSEELEKADTLRLANILIPLLQQPPEAVGKPVKQLLLAFNKDPKQWLPKPFIDAMNGKQKQPTKPIAPPQITSNTTTNNTENAQTVVPQNEVATNPTLGSRVSSAFKAFRNPSGGNGASNG